MWYLKKDTRKPEKSVYRGTKLSKSTFSTLHSGVEEYILARIHSGAWSIGDRIPSERELCLQLKVSRKTVRTGLKSLETLGILERGPRSGTFIKKHVLFNAKGEVGTGRIALIICKDRKSRAGMEDEPFYLDVIHWLQENLLLAGYVLTFSYLDEQEPHEVKQFEELLNHIDGIILSEAENPELIKRLIEKAVPHVLILSLITQNMSNQIDIDLVSGAQIAVENLIALGHERIGMICGPLHLKAAAQRFAGYRKALESAAIPFREELVEEASGWLKDAGEQATTRLLTRQPSISALFCATDGLAIGALASCYGMGIRVPNDLSVSGFDDSILARNAIPALTSVRINVAEIARQAVKRLLEVIANPAETPVKIQFPLTLAIRASTEKWTGVNMKEVKK